MSQFVDSDLEIENVVIKNRKTRIQTQNKKQKVEEAKQFRRLCRFVGFHQQVTEEYTRKKKGNKKTSKFVQDFFLE